MTVGSVALRFGGFIADNRLMVCDTFIGSVPTDPMKHFHSLRQHAGYSPA